MIAALALAWLAIGALVLGARAGRATRAGLGVVATGAWVGGVALVIPRLGGVLGVTAMMLAAMAFGSIAALLALRPRIYAASVAAAGVLAVLAAVLA